jgi:transcriptional accessory protein Tex/SPT6
MTNYSRPELTKDEQAELYQIARKINNIYNLQNRRNYILTLLLENAQLTKEVNEHRAAGDFDLLPVVDNSKARIA